MRRRGAGAERDDIIGDADVDVDVDVDVSAAALLGRKEDVRKSESYKGHDA